MNKVHVDKTFYKMPQNSFGLLMFKEYMYSIPILTLFYFRLADRIHIARNL